MIKFYTKIKSIRPGLRTQLQLQVKRDQILTCRNTAPPIRIDGFRPKALVIGEAKKEEMRPAT